MTVQQLINMLERVKDKDQPVVFWGNISPAHINSSLSYEDSLYIGWNLHQRFPKIMGPHKTLAERSLSSKPHKQ